MEALAYTHLSLAHDEAANLDPTAYELKLFKGLNWKPPSSAWIGLIASIMALSLMGLANSAMAAFVRTNGSPLHVRSGPSTSYPIVGSLPNGASISLSGRTSGDWSQLFSTNWVNSYWISGDGGGGSGSPGTRLVRVSTSGSPLNVRSSPSPNSPIIYTLTNGTQVRAGTIQNGWTALDSGGWASTQYLVTVGGGSSGGTPSGYLQRGSNGQAVVNLQNRLRVLGFYNGPTTGYYGSLTETAIRQFQASRAIQVNGIAGPQTQAALYRSGGGSGGGNYTGVYLQPGSSGQTVVDLQNRLRVLGFYTGPITGYYGGLTETAVRRFQASRRIQVNGIAGPQTLGAVYSNTVAVI